MSREWSTLITVHNSLMGTGLRNRIKIGASGKVATGADLAKRLLQAPTTPTPPAQ